MYYTLYELGQRKRLLIVLGASALVLGVALFFGGKPAWDWARDKYSKHKQDRALAQVTTFLEAKNYEAAGQALRVALESAPGNAGTWRVAADMIEQAGLKESIMLRRRVLEMEPAENKNRLALARTALRFGDYDTAFDNYIELDPVTKDSSEGERLALTLSLAGRLDPVADYLFTKLKSKEPGDKRIILGHASLLLRHPSPEKAQEARATLESFGEDPEFALPALRELYLDAMARRDGVRALKIGQKILATGGLLLSDRIMVADGELLYGGASFPKVQTDLGKLAGAKAEDAVLYARWLLGQQRLDEAVLWINSLSSEILTSPPLLELRADLAFGRKAWLELGPLLGRGAWGAVSPEALHLAVSTQLVSNKDNQNLRHRVWQEAVASAQGSLSSLKVLHRLASGLSQQEETLTVLVEVSERFPLETWAHAARISLCRRMKDTRGMLAGLRRWRTVDRNSVWLRYNEILLEAMVSNSTWDLDSPSGRAMDELRKGHPENPFFLTGVAFLRAKAERGEEAFAVARLLSPEAEKEPGRAPYLAYIYAKARKKDRVIECLNRAKNQSYLPEELRLLEYSRSYVETDSLLLPNLSLGSGN